MVDTDAGLANGEADEGSSTERDTAAPEGYRTYHNSDFGFSMAVPEDSSVQAEGPGRLKIQLLGPLNEPFTEVTDGFTLTVFEDELDTSYASAEEYAEAVIADTRSVSENEIATELEARSVNGMPAYRYSYRGALGSLVTEYLFLPDAGTGYQISYIISDPENRDYEDMVFTMLESL